MGAIYNRWKVVAWLGPEPRAFRWLCKQSTSELPSNPVITPTTFHLNPTRLHHHLAIVQTRPCPPMLGFVDKFVMFVLLLVRHVFFWVIIILHRRLEGWVSWNNRLKRAPRGSCCWIFSDIGLMISNIIQWLYTNQWE